MGFMFDLGKEDQSFMWLSFADEETGKFNGAVITQGEDIIEAIKRAHMLGINPGGQVLGHKIPQEAMKHIKYSQINCVLNKSAAQELADYLDWKAREALASIGRVQRLK
jgi:hypothetical protein